MKIFNTILTAVCGIAILASCDKLNETPSFSKSESFVSFPSSSAMINEDGGQIVIPVNMASINPIATAVSYELVDGTAKEGIDYIDTNESAVLSFDGESRSANIVIDIVNRQGDYTGDLSFTINLLSATGLKIGNESVCKVTIGDLDHPLANILGEYDGTATSYWDGEVAWTMTLYKDPSDVNVVWIDGVTNEVGSYNNGLFYANVFRDEEGEIAGMTAPSGQYMNYPGVSGYWIRLVGYKAGGGGSFYPNDSITWNYSDGKFTIDPEADINSLGLVIYGPSDKTVAYGWYNRYDIAPAFTKK